eukprot:TRINITY_DN7345_c0_g1_i1.p1 TRINITY_DN7345_c0_g1~~TRINITY_DN7345_c0_g1_i1.p1  ORF type:complete len:203 (+),score=6.33 TRINITY_DN7345_c0_g1_i1:48-611(+)
MKIIYSLTIFHNLFYLIVNMAIITPLTGLPWWFVLASAHVATVFALTTHWMGHRKIIMWWYNAHMGHHVGDYPPSKFLTEGYTAAKKDNSKAYYLTIILTPITMCIFGYDQLLSFTVAIATTLFLLGVADFFHQGFHTRGFILENYQFFQHLRAVHYYHHYGSMKFNYAVGDFLYEYLFSEVKVGKY